MKLSWGRGALSKLRTADDERQAKRNSLADKLTVEAKALADLIVTIDAKSLHNHLRCGGIERSGGLKVTTAPR